MGLPSGQDVARAMSVPVISDDDLRIGKATEQDSAANPRLVDLPGVGREFVGKAPLWYYILAEAQQNFKTNATPIRLGPVGGRIVTEVLVGLMLGDRHSFLVQEPTWTPNSASRFTMADLIKQAIG
jgi:hypothetical protein